MNLKGINQTKSQEANRTLLLKLIKRFGITSRVELAQITELKQATITYIINNFIEWGLVKEVGNSSGEKGRRTISISLNEKAFYVIGIRLTRQFFDIGLFNAVGKVLTKKRISIHYNETPEYVLKNMITEAKKILEDNKGKKVFAIGVAVPGPYYPHLGKIMAITEFQGWDDVCIKDEFEQAFDIPVIIEHDANAGAIEEWWDMSIEESRGLLIYVAIGQGVGAGILQDGSLFKGAYGTAGEIGHISMNIYGEKCLCNNRGCLTHYISTITLMKKVKTAIQNLPSKTTLREDFTFSELCQAINAHDEVAYPIFHEEIVRYLGTMLVNLIWIYSPNMIVLGDEMTEIGDILIKELKKFVKDHTKDYLYEWTQIQLSTLNSDPAFLGAGEIAIDYLLSNPSRLTDK